MVAAFQEYLKQHGLRRTPERFAILDAVCSCTGHFTPDTLQEMLDRERHFTVSRATLYNNINLLVDAGLVIRHRLASKAEYEKVPVTDNVHFHFVCTECGSIREFHDEKLVRVLGGVRSGKFNVCSYVLYIQGVCAKCMSARKRRENRKNKTK